MIERRAELAGRLSNVRERVAAAARTAGRDNDSITLVVVTKTFPVSDVELLAGLGVRDVGESRHQEAREKVAAVTAELTWHFVGALQSNKAGAVAGYADVVHSIDRERLVSALDHGAQRAGRTLDCLVQVSLDPPDTHTDRSGAPRERVIEIAAKVSAAERLRLRGVMTVAPMTADPGEAFGQLADVAAELRAEFPAATVISAGMSEDLEAAIEAGATHVRIGRAILGQRPPLG
ncbi:YggS family pyridoxal phosphate-dependent enzyme [soil metagenome]